MPDDGMTLRLASPPSLRPRPAEGTSAEMTSELDSQRDGGQQRRIAIQWKLLGMKYTRTTNLKLPMLSLLRKFNKLFFKPRIFF